MLFITLLNTVLHLSSAFQPAKNEVATLGSRSRTMRALSAELTPRQLQFWDDVDNGLIAIEKFYQEKGQSMERIRTFCTRAQGLLPLSEPAAIGQEPSEENIDGLTAKAYWDAVTDAENFPWAAQLEANSHVIIEEFERNLLQSEKAERIIESSLFSGDSAWQSKVMGTGWSAYRLQRLGVWNVENCALFPKTYELLRKLDIPLAVRGVCFARQAPGSGVAPHSDGRNFILTSHLGLKIPDGCWINVGGCKKSWSEGKLTTLDTSFVHSTGNPSSTDRHVLIIDYWHPELSDAERAGLEFIYDLRNKFETGNIPFREVRPKVQKGQGIGAVLNFFKGEGQ